MSYDIELVDPITGESLELDSTHHMRDRRMPAGALGLFCTRIGVSYEAEFGGA